MLCSIAYRCPIDLYNISITLAVRLIDWLTGVLYNIALVRNGRNDTIVVCVMWLGTSYNGTQVDYNLMLSHSYKNIFKKGV